MASAAVGVVGASGYSGAVCAALAVAHPDLELVFATSDKAAGESVAARLGLSDTCKLHFSSHEKAAEFASKVSVIVLATSAELAMELAPALAEKTRVVDLSGAFRLEASAYPKWYGFTHAAPAALEHAFYGLPELFGAPPADTRLVSNPGCYATAALLATAPIVRGNFTASDHVIIDGKSGVSGAGRRADESYSFVELAEDVRAYKVGTHQHTPEIARHLHRHAQRASRVTFTPHLIPLRRGLVVTAYMTARDGVTTDAVQAAFTAAYANAPLVRVVPIDRVSVHAAAGTPFAFVGAAVSDGTIITMCALDNLLKGAASQAIQNINGMLGLAPTAGLDGLMRFAP